MLPGLSSCSAALEIHKSISHCCCHIQSSILSSSKLLIRESSPYYYLSSYSSFFTTTPHHLFPSQQVLRCTIKTVVYFSVLYFRRPAFGTCTCTSVGNSASAHHSPPHLTSLRFQFSVPLSMKKRKETETNK